jgi:hypothetical protein
MFEIQKTSDVPKDPHYVVVIFDTYTPYTGWENEGGTASPRPLPRIYATMEREDWTKKIKEIESKNEARNTYAKKIEYIAYHVDAVASITKSINIGVNHA